MAPERDWQDAQIIFAAGRYHWSLFIAQLAIEKLLKSLIIRNEATPPLIHNLDKLAVVAGLNIPDILKPWLNEITSFNIEARYDDEKFRLYKKATKSYTTRWLDRAAKVYQWLSDQ